MDLKKRNWVLDKFLQFLSLVLILFMIQIEHKGYVTKNNEMTYILDLMEFAFLWIKMTEKLKFWNFNLISFSTILTIQTWSNRSKYNFQTHIDRELEFKKFKKKKQSQHYNQVMRPQSQSLEVLNQTDQSTQEKEKQKLNPNTHTHTYIIPRLNTKPKMNKQRDLIFNIFNPDTSVIKQVHTKPT